MKKLLTQIIETGELKPVRFVKFIEENNVKKYMLFIDKNGNLYRKKIKIE